MNVEDVMLSEISQSHIYWGKKGKTKQVLQDSTYKSYLRVFTSQGQKVKWWLRRDGEWRIWVQNFKMTNTGGWLEE
jgi:hypothetical protein